MGMRHVSGISKVLTPTLIVNKRPLEKNTIPKCLEYLAVMRGKRGRDGYANENYQLLRRRKNEFNSFRLKMAATKHEQQCSFMTEETNVIRILKYSAHLSLWRELLYYLPLEKPENNNYCSSGT